MRRTRTPARTGFRLSTALCALVAGLAVIGSGLVLSHPAQAQSAPAASNTQDLLKAEELDQLLAPIALYPDTLLSQVLTASTYPLEVVQADRWVKENKGLKGDALKQALDKQSWDDTVKALAVAPDVLNMMSTKLDWMQKLGDAVLAQQADVMDAVQRLRKKAQANDKLKTTKEQKVSTNTQAGKEYIVIEPADPSTLYVPFFDPLVVYGAWPYPAYPPYVFPAPYYFPGGLLATGVAFATGVAVGAWARGGGWWGGGFNWGNNNININNNIDINKVRNWQHNVDHRGGVRYRNDAVRQKYANRDLGGGANQRLDFRGRDGQQVLRPDAGRPGGDRPGGIDRPGGGDRPGAGNRPGGGDRPGAGNRPGGGDRPGAGNRPGGDRPGAGNRPAQRPAAGGGRPGGGGALANIDRGGGAARAEALRGRASLGGGGGGGRQFSGGGGGGRQFSGGGGGGGFRGGGGGGGRGRR